MLCYLISGEFKCLEIQRAQRIPDGTAVRLIVSFIEALDDLGLAEELVPVRLGGKVEEVLDLRRPEAGTRLDELQQLLKVHIRVFPGAVAALRGGGTEPRVHVQYLSCLMIDKRYQGNGCGRQAMKLALAFTRTFPAGEAKHCWLSYKLGNEAARKLSACTFYADFLWF